MFLDRYSGRHFYLKPLPFSLVLRAQIAYPLWFNKNYLCRKPPLTPMKLTKLFNDFFHSEKSGGIILIICTIISVVLANSGLGSLYASIWNYGVGGH